MTSSRYSKSRSSLSRAGRRSKGFERAGGASRQTVSSLAEKKGFAEADVLLRWPEIVGAAQEKLCQPQAVKFSKDRGLGATLVVETTSARAAEVSHLAPVMIERINSYYGYRAISRIRVSQTVVTPAPGFAEEQAGFTNENSEREPTPEDHATAARLASGIQSAGLRAALERMGAYVLASAKHKA